MKCYIIGSAPGAKLSVIKKIKPKEGDLVICADGGLDYAKAAGIKPNVIVGDFDSAQCTPDEKGCEVITFNKYKDFTDARLAADIGLERGYKELEFYACTGGRFDHMYANILLLYMLCNKGCSAKMTDHEAQYYFIDKDHELINKKDRTISLFAIANDVEGITLEGFRFPLNDYYYSSEDSIGISNVTVSDTAKIKLKKGQLFVVEYNREF